MKCLIALTLCTLSMLTGCGRMSMGQLTQTNEGAPTGTGFSIKTVKVDGEDRKYGVFVPHSYNASKRWPVIVFLHGVLESGSDGTACMAVGLAPSIAKVAANFGFIAVFPQSTGDWVGDERLRIPVACLDQVQKDYATDTAHVGLTGLSNGGYGVWALGARYPDRFSCLAPMAGYTDYDDVPKLTRIPIWCFHNSGDFLVSPGGSEEMCKRIQAAGGNARFTKLDGMGHNCWEEVYDGGDLFKWMLTTGR